MYKVTAATEGSIELKQNDNWYNAQNTDRIIDTVIISFYDTIGDVYKDILNK